MTLPMQKYNTPVCRVRFTNSVDSNEVVRRRQTQRDIITRVVPRLSQNEHIKMFILNRFVYCASFIRQRLDVQPTDFQCCRSAYISIYVVFPSCVYVLVHWLTRLRDAYCSSRLKRRRPSPQTMVEQSLARGTARWACVVK